MSHTLKFCHQWFNFFGDNKIQMIINCMNMTRHSYYILIFILIKLYSIEKYSSMIISKFVLKNIKTLLF